MGVDEKIAHVFHTESLSWDQYRRWHECEHGLYLVLLNLARGALVCFLRRHGSFGEIWWTKSLESG